MTSRPQHRGVKGRVRLELDQHHAQALHAAISEALHAQLLEGDRRDAARKVLERLDRRVPGWLDSGPVAGEAGYLIAAEAVLRRLVDAEDGTYPRSSASPSCCASSATPSRSARPPATCSGACAARS